MSAVFERKAAEAERLASELIELSTRYNFAFWLAEARALCGWARSASGDTIEGLSWIEQGIEDYRAAGALVGLSIWLAMDAKETEIEASFRGAISTAKQQKANSLLARAETTYAEYRRQKVSALGGQEIRLPLW